MAVTWARRGQAQHGRTAANLDYLLPLSSVYKKTLEYVDTFSRFTERDTVVAARK